MESLPEMSDLTEIPNIGPATARSLIAAGIPDVLGADRAAHAGRTTLVVGAGHSAMNVVLDLVDLAGQVPGTQVIWAFRRPLGGVNFGGGARDAASRRGCFVVGMGVQEDNRGHG